MRGPAMERPGRRSMRTVRTSWRVRTAAGVCGVVALVVAAVPARTMVLVNLGRSALDRGDTATATSRFASAEKWATVQKWVAPYDGGVAQYRASRFDAAASKFETAAGLAPEEEQCRIRLNWAWSLEASADRWERADNHPEALIRLRQGVSVLTVARCTTSSQAAQMNSTRSRMDGKARGSADEGEQSNASGQGSDRQDELEKREKEAQAQRQKALDQANTSRKDAGSGTGRTW